MIFRHRSTAIALSATALALVLAGCGSSDSTAAGKGSSSQAAAYGPAATGPHSAQDVSFLSDMLPHHSQAVEMADMALTRETDPKVKALAQQIKGEQAPEIRSMGGWLTGWGEPVPGAAGHDMHAMGAGGDGMMSDGDMAALDKASGATFATLWLEGMTRHHNGAVDMAKVELAGGQNEQAKALATSIIAAQTSEIATMKGILAG